MTGGLRRRTGVGTTVLVGLTLALGVAGWGQIKSPTVGGRFAIGKFTVNYGTARIKGDRTKASNGQVELVNGLNGAPNAEILSTQYDLAAPKITMDIRNQVMDTATATGGVRVVTRERDGLTGKLRPAINLHSDTANYVGERKSADGTTRHPRLELRGNVKGTYFSPLFSDTDPLKVDTDAVDIEFPDATTAEVILHNGTITATPVEPPKSEKPAGKKPR